MSVLLGTLLVPLSAYAASVLVSDGSQGESAATTSTVTAQPQVDTVFASQTATPADLEAACGPAGMSLAEAEADGSISDVQQAALDALREICDEQGMPLPGKPAPDPITQTVVVSRTSQAPSSGQEAQVTDDQSQPEIEDEHEDGYEDHYEDEDEDDHGEEHEEDDEHEEDED